MSQHPSLRSSEKDKQQRTVLKRYERLKALKDKEKWKEGDSVFGLSKVKIVRFKIKKEKAAAAEDTEAAVAPGGAAPAAAPGKGATAKDAGKQPQAGGADKK